MGVLPVLFCLLGPMSAVIAAGKKPPRPSKPSNTTRPLDHTPLFAAFRDYTNRHFRGGLCDFSATSSYFRGSGQGGEGINSCFFHFRDFPCWGFPWPAKGKRAGESHKSDVFVFHSILVEEHLCSGSASAGNAAQRSRIKKKLGMGGAVLLPLTQEAISRTHRIHHVM